MFSQSGKKMNEEKTPLASDSLLPRPRGIITCSLCLSVTTTVLGMINFGYNTGVTNTPARLIKNFYNATYYSRYEKTPDPALLTVLWAFTVAVFAIGGMLGALIAGWWGNKFGRKNGIILNTMPGIVAALMMVLAKPAKSPGMVIIGRFLIGFNCGLSTGLVPMYNSEISPVHVRGALGTVNQTAITIGILLSQVLGLPDVLGTPTGWPYLLGLSVVPSLLQVVLMPLNPESPRHLLLTKHQEDRARIALERLRGTGDIDLEIKEMKEEKQNKESEAQMSIWQLLCSSSLRLPLAVGVVMHLSQQLCGINSILSYSTSLFCDVGVTEDKAKYATLAVGGLMLVMALVTIPLMDRLGRRTLQLTGLAGTFMSGILFTIFFSYVNEVEAFKELTVVFALLVVAFFALGPGPVPWMIVPELFSQGSRPAAVSIATLVNWLANFVAAQSFPSLQESLKSLVFLPFTVLTFIFWIFLFKFLPETKNKTVEEISRLFKVQGQQAETGFQMHS